MYKLRGRLILHPWTLSLALFRLNDHPRGREFVAGSGSCRSSAAAIAEQPFSELWTLTSRCAVAGEQHGADKVSLVSLAWSGKP